LRRLTLQAIAAHSITVREVATTACEARDGKVWRGKCADVLRAMAAAKKA
jgi:hypothetical protein